MLGWVLLLLALLVGEELLALLLEVFDLRFDVAEEVFEGHFDGPG